MRRRHSSNARRRRGDRPQRLAAGGPGAGRLRFFHWTLDACSPRARLHGRIEAPASVFVGLNYLNPPGGAKTCLNTKLAAAEFTLERPGRPAKTFTARTRAAFELLTDRSDHGVSMLA